MHSGLTDLYRQLGERLPRVEGNPCGECLACCTALGATFHNVQEVEHAHLARRHGDEAAARFRAFAERARGPDGGYVHAVCPFYDHAAHGCGIYADRPFACRVFGHFRLSGTSMPEGCVFSGREVVVSEGRYFEDVPLARELQAMARSHSFQQPMPWGGAAPGAVDHALVSRARANADPANPVDMGVVLHLEGRHEEALAVLQGVPGALAAFYRGTILQELGRTRQAVNAYLEACKLDPANPRFIVHLAIALMECGRTSDARSCFGRAVELQPRDALARGFLGVLLLAEGDVGAAVEHLEASVTLDASNPFFRLRLGDGLQRLGRDGSEHLRFALEHAATAGEAGRLLSGEPPGPS